MGAVVPGLRVLRLVLLGGALSVMWLLFTATSSSAAPAGDHRSLPLVGEMPVVRDVAATALQPEVTETAAPPTERQKASRTSLPHKAVRTVTHPVERTVSNAAEVTAADRTSSTVVDLAASATDSLASAPVLAPVTEPVVDEVVKPLLSTTDELSTTVLDQARSTVDDVEAVVRGMDEVVEDVVPTSGDVLEPTAPAGDEAAPVVPGPAPEEASAQDSAHHAAGPLSPRKSSAVADAPSGPMLLADEIHGLTTGSREVPVAGAQRADRNSLPVDPGVPSSPLGLSPGCAPGASASSGGQSDLAAYRTPMSVPVSTTKPTGGSGHTASVPGPSVLPGFSPE